MCGFLDELKFLGIVILTNVFSRMWTLPEADEVEVPNLRRGEEAERKTGDCNVRKVIYFLASVIS